MGKKEKIYFNTKTDDGGILFSAKPKYGVELNIRLAGKPKFILAKYMEKYGDIAGIAMYKDLLDIMADIGADGFSPIVGYINKN